MDIKKGDTIRYSYYVYGTQVLTNGVVSEVKEDGSCVIDQGNTELIVDKKSILERLPRKDETESKKVIEEKSEEEHFNEMHTGISLHKKDKVVEEPVVKKETETTSNKKFNHFGGK